jgi:hypothetical protein
MAPKSQHAYALQRAVDVLGGAAQTARRLSMSQTRLTLCLEDLQPIPDAVFLTLVEILTDADVARLLKEAQAERARRDGGTAYPNNEKSGE